MTKAKPQNVISAVEATVAAAEAAGEEDCLIPTELARALLDRAKKSGRPPLSRSAQLREGAAIAGARIRKRELIEGGMAHEAAEEQAAEEAVERLRRRGLSVSTFRRRMQRSPRPR